jgi:hypothetical protein
LVLVDVLKGAGGGLVVEEKIALPVSKPVELDLKFGGLLVQVLILFSQVGNGLFIQLDVISDRSLSLAVDVVSDLDLIFEQEVFFLNSLELALQLG